jgi:hypothetical protein
LWLCVAGNAAWAVFVSIFRLRVEQNHVDFTTSSSRANGRVCTNHLACAA